MGEVTNLASGGVGLVPPEMSTYFRALLYNTISKSLYCINRTLAHRLTVYATRSHRLTVYATISIRNGITQVAT